MAIFVIGIILALVPKQVDLSESERLQLVHLLQNKKEDENQEDVIIQFTKDFHPSFWEAHQKPIVQRRTAAKWTGILIFCFIMLNAN